MDHNMTRDEKRALCREFLALHQECWWALGMDATRSELDAIERKFSDLRQRSCDRWSAAEVVDAEDRVLRHLQFPEESKDRDVDYGIQLG